jgi:hypothetical protein
VKIVSETIRRLKDSQDLRVSEGLGKVFEATSRKDLRQGLAWFLLTHGEKNDVYYDELARYAREAITSSAPLWVEYDQFGNANKERLAPEFRPWCDANNLKFEDCYRLVSGFPIDVSYLAWVRDKRAVPLLRQGLGSSNHAIVDASIQGLAFLNDTASLPLIEASLLRLRPLLRPLAADGLAEFDDPRIGPLLDRFIPDKKWREEIEARRKLRPAHPQ